MLTHVVTWLTGLVTKRFTGRTVIDWYQGIPKKWEQHEQGKFPDT
jgi:hypothetical protein